MSVEEGDTLLDWFFKGFNTNNLQTVLLSLSTLGFGFHLGIKYIAGAAYASQQRMSGQLIAMGALDKPGWVQAAQTADKAALAVFALAFFAVLAVEWWDIRRGKVS